MQQLVRYTEEKYTSFHISSFDGCQSAFPMPTLITLVPQCSPFYIFHYQIIADLVVNVISGNEKKSCFDKEAKKIPTIDLCRHRNKDIFFLQYTQAQI